MDRMNESLEDITNYLISLFYMTDCKYSCTRTKIGKLLSIIAFSYACEDKKLFDDEIYKGDKLGPIIPVLQILWFPLEIYSFGKDEKCYDDMTVINEKFNEDVEFSTKFYNNQFLSVELKERVENVFRRFGAYPSVELSFLLKPIVINATYGEYDEIDLSKISSVIQNTVQSNEMIEYFKLNFLQIKQKVKSR